ncbi:hypothetical protein HMPREF9120_01987 [Neisseria sp. oral taxon 020 str. F0370]|nr:hypothetical protein HMPREF9120_01987 [Neisseria sp. oral taxon 020 str. F0370]
MSCKNCRSGISPHPSPPPQAGEGTACAGYRRFQTASMPDLRGLLLSDGLCVTAKAV